MIGGCIIQCTDVCFYVCDCYRPCNCIYFLLQCYCVTDIIMDLQDFNSLNIDYECKLHSFKITNFDIVSRFN